MVGEEGFDAAGLPDPDPKLSLAWDLFPNDKHKKSPVID